MEIQHRRGNPGPGEHVVDMAAVVGLVVEEVCEEQVDGVVAAPALVVHVADRSPKNPSSMPAAKASMRASSVCLASHNPSKSSYRISSRLVEDTSSPEKRQPYAVADHQVVEGAADAAEEGGPAPRAWGRGAKDGVVEPPVGQRVVPGKPPEVPYQRVHRAPPPRDHSSGPPGRRAARWRRYSAGSSRAGRRRRACPPCRRTRDTRDSRRTSSRP